MTLKLGINGFGRIGRNVLRALMEQGRTDMQVVAINDLSPLETSAHLFEFDSVHGRYGRPVTLGSGTMDVGTGPIRVTSEREPDKLPWEDVDIALECTGFFRTPELAGLHLKNGSKRVLISAPGKGDVKTVVFGVNDTQITADDQIISNASCTTPRAQRPLPRARRRPVYDPDHHRGRENAGRCVAASGRVDHRHRHSRAHAQCVLH